MSELEFLRLGLRVLDEQLVDADGRRCGRVEDVEFDGGLGRSAQVIGILCGATAWKRRLRPGIAELIPGDPAGLHRVPWSDIQSIGNEIELARLEADLDDAADREAAPLALSELLGVQVVDHHNESVGRLHEVLVARPRDAEDGTPWSMHGVLVGWRALLQRAGFQPLLTEQMERGELPPNLIRWEWVVRFDEEGRLALAPPRFA